MPRCGKTAMFAWEVDADKKHEPLEYLAAGENKASLQLWCFA